MKLNTILLLAFTTTITPALASDAPANPCKFTPHTNIQLCEDENDEEQEQCEAEECEPELLKKEEAAAFLKENMPFLLKEFTEFINEDPSEEELEEMLMDISEFKAEYTDLNEYKPELGALFLEVEKLDYELQNTIDQALTEGSTAEETIALVKDQFTTLFNKRITLEKGRIKQAKDEIADEEKEIQELEKDKEAAIKEELAELLKMLKEDADNRLN